MKKITRFAPSHLLSVADPLFYSVHGHQGYAFELARHESHTVWIDGKVAMCFGCVPAPDGSFAEVWSFVSPTASMLILHRVAVRWLATLTVPRLFAHSVATFEAGCRWLRMLGFHVNPLAKIKDPFGRDCVQYVKEL